MVTSDEVAQLAGVSRSTVSRVLNGSGSVSKKAQKRVHEAIRQLGYEPNVVAQNLARQASHTIALSLFANTTSGIGLSELTHTQHFSYLEVLDCIEQEIIHARYDVLLHSRSPSDLQETYVRSLQTRQVAGTIMIAPHPADPRIRELVEAAIPTVFIDNMAHGKKATYVKPDNIDGVRKATEHLLQLGHRRIAFLTGKMEDVAGTERFLGGQQALASAGLTLDPALLCQTDWSTEHAYQVTRTLLQERRDFTAILAGSDIMAMGILQAIYEQGLRVPDDLSVIGFDDISFSRYTCPPLTTVRQDRSLIGKGAVQRLIALIEGESDVPPLIVPVQLVVRQSTGSAPSWS